MKEPQAVKIGYWRWAGNETLPMPEADTPGLLQAEVVAALEAEIRTGRMLGYRGCSICRICGKANGSRELVIIKDNTKYHVPEGYLHYLKSHNVGYDQRLLVALNIPRTPLPCV